MSKQVTFITFNNDEQHFATPWPIPAGFKLAPKYGPSLNTAEVNNRSAFRPNYSRKPALVSDPETRLGGFFCDPVLAFSVVLVLEFKGAGSRFCAQSSTPANS
jgi:hypothetical protein